MFNLQKILFWRKPRREYLYHQQSSFIQYLLFILKLLIVGILFIAMGISFVMYMDSANAETQPNSHSVDPHASSIVTLDQVRQGSLLTKGNFPGQYQPLPMINTDVDITISGMIARTHVTQSFHNSSDNWIEAIYVFPLPEDSAVDHMSMTIGERTIEGIIKEKAQAKKIFEQARQQGKKASLIEQQRPNLFTNTVANIAPGETIRVSIEYQQLSGYDNNEFSLRFPMAITPRYIPGNSIKGASSITGSGWAINTHQVKDASQITPPLHTGSDNFNPVTLKIKLDAGLSLDVVSSRYHKINQYQDSQNIYHIELDKSFIAADRDFELVWSTNTAETPEAALFSQKIGADYYQLIMLMPPHNSESLADTQPMARDVTFVIDTSGSMYGTSIQQAKQALLLAIDRLRLHDRFNIIQFNSNTEQLFQQNKLASFHHVQLAKNYITNLHADGGTEMLPALQLALHTETYDQTVKQIIFLTDGSIGNESELFDLIHQKLGDARLFTIGIGSAPNSYFMRKAAQFGHGSYTYVSNINEVQEKMLALFNKLENPLMTQLTINFDNKDKAEIWPEKIPDLYKGEPVVLAIRSSSPPQNIQFNGLQTFSPWSYSLSSSSISDNPGIAIYWARQKIASLMDSIHQGASKDDVRHAVTELALDHHLVSKYTSLVAVDTTVSRPENRLLNKKNIPSTPPHGQLTNGQQISQPTQLAQTASPASRHILFGSILLFLALLSPLVPTPSLKKRL